MKTIDRLIIAVLGYLTLFLLLMSGLKNAVGAGLIAFLLCVLIDRGLKLLFSKLKSRKKMRPEEMETLFAIMGAEKQCEHFFTAIPVCFSPEKIGGGILLTVNCEKNLLVPCYKFSPCGFDDVAKAYRTAVDNSAEKILILSKKCTKDVVLFAERFPVKYTFLSSKKIADYLYKQNKLPCDIFARNQENIHSSIFDDFRFLKEKYKSFPKKILPSLRTIIGEVFVRRRAKFFLFSSCSLALLSLFVPWNIYYIVFSVVTLIFGIVCLTKNPYEI